MTSLEKRLQDPDYKAWVKAGICLGFIKTGLENYADERSKLFHQAVLNQLASTGRPGGLTVCGQALVRKGKMSCCYLCQKYIDEIDRQNSYSFKFQQGNWDNSSPQLWPKDPWEMAKVFMNPGQKIVHRKPSDTDLSGILNFIDHCQIAKRDIVNAQNIAKLRDSRNTVMHTSSMALANADFIKFTDAMIDLLTDPGALGKMADAQEAVRNIQEVRTSGFHISKEEEFKVLSERYEVLQLKLKLLQREVQTIRTDTNARERDSKQCYEDLKHIEVKTDENMAEIQRQVEAMKILQDEIASAHTSLKMKIEESEDLKMKLQAHIEETDSLLHEVNPKLQAVTQETTLIHGRLDALEFQSEIQIAQGKDLFVRQATLEEREEAITEQVHALQLVSGLSGTIESKQYRQEVNKLKQLLVEEYKHIGFEVSLSPIYEGLNDDIIKVSVEELYSDLTIVKVDKKEEELHSLTEIFHTKGKRNRTIFVKGVAGAGKSTWCMQLLYVWSKLHDRIHTRIKEVERNTDVSSNRLIKDIEEALSMFDFLIFIPLRYIEGKASIKDIIFSSTLGRLSNFKGIMRRIIDTESENVLILIDGIDEYAQTLSYDGLNQCTVIATTRPWKYDLICTQNPSLKIDIVLEIKGLNKVGVGELTEKIYGVLYEKENCNLTHIEYQEEQIKAQAKTFLELIRSIGLSDSVKIPLILIILLESYIETGTLSPSLTCNLIKLVEILVSRGEQKLSDRESKTLAHLKRNWLEQEHCLKPILHNAELSDYAGLLGRLSYLAFMGITSSQRENSLVFSEKQLLQFLNHDELNVCFRYGLLSKSKYITSLLSKLKVCVSFYHKLIQEFFAALWIVSNEKDLVNVKASLNCIEKILEMENVIAFICGLEPHTGSDLTKYFIEICDRDISVNDWRNDTEYSFSENVFQFSHLILRCQTEVSLSHEPSVPLFISDICVWPHPIFMEQLLQVSSRSVQFLKSLTFYGLDVSCIIWCELLKIINYATALQILKIEAIHVRDMNEEVMQNVNIDLSKHYGLQSVYVHGKARSVPSPLLPLMKGIMSGLNIKNLQLVYMDAECCGTLLNVMPGLENLEILFMRAMSFSGSCLLVQSKRLKTLYLNDINFSESSLVLRNVNDLEMIYFRRLRILPSDWKTLLGQFRSQVSLRVLELEDIESSVDALNLENSSGLKRLRLSNLEIRGIKVSDRAAPSELELVKVDMPSISWTELFKSLRFDQLRKLSLIQLDIGEAVLSIESAVQLEALTISDVKVCNRLIGAGGKLEDKNMVPPICNAWERFFEYLPTISLQYIGLYNLDIGKAKLGFGTSKCLKTIVMEDLAISKVCYENLQSSLSGLPALLLVDIQDLKVDGTNMTITYDYEKREVI